MLKLINIYKKLKPGDLLSLENDRKFCFYDNPKFEGNASDNRRVDVLDPKIIFLDRAYYEEATLSTQFPGAFPVVDEPQNKVFIKCIKCFLVGMTPMRIRWFRVIDKYKVTEWNEKVVVGDKCVTVEDS